MQNYFIRRGDLQILPNLPPVSTQVPFSAPHNILHLEDNRADAELVHRLLRAEWPGCHIRPVLTRAEYDEELELNVFDLILSDYSLPDFDGLTALDLARTRCPLKPFIFISGTIGEERAITALQQGAIDYIIKDRPGRLIPAIRNALSVAAETARRHEDEEALRQSQERFRQITENVADMIAVLDLEGRRLYNNPAYHNILGDPDALRGTESFNDIHPEDRERIRALFANMVSTGIGSRTEYRFLLADGSVRYIESHGSVIRDVAGRIGSVLVVSRDVTERLAAERRLREQAALLDKSRDAIIATDLEYRISYWNPSAEQLYGWTAGQATGQILPQLGLGFEAGRFAAAREQLFADGEWRGVFTLQARDGHTVQVESTWSLIRTDDGQPRSILVVDTDVTEKKKLETQLLQAQRVESIGTLTGGIAHDLNNVLAPILMGGGMLRLGVTDPADLKLVEIIIASARHGADLIRQLLIFARGAEGEHHAVQPGKLLREIEPLIRQSLPDKVQFVFSVDFDALPVMADSTQIKQVILNLALNARDAMPQGGRLTIRIRNVTVDGTWRRRMSDGKGGPYICLSVTDTGTGIPPSLLEKIFDPFFTTKEIGKGTGLGLSTVHGIVKGHGGFLKVESEVGHGTTFHIFLPALVTRPAPATDPTLPVPARGRGETILVVDNDAGMRGIMKPLLEYHGYAVILAGDGREGLEQFRNRTGLIAAVITNLVLPQINGPALIAALRTLDPGVRIIVISGVGKAGAVPVETIDPPVAAVLHKPFEAAPLLAALSQVLGHLNGGMDETRTRDLLRDRQTL